MKRYGNLFAEIGSFKNLLLAAKKAQRGKRFKKSAAAFNLELEHNLLSIQSALRSGSYRMGRYRHFYVFDPKRRFISAAPYSDRVVQHALCNVIEPIFDRAFIFDSYACRKEKGTHKAVSRFQQFARKNTYVLKCDVRNYFATIDHVRLLRMIQRKIKDAGVLRLIEIIIASSADPGIPIGNLSSQIFANLYLNDIDHYLKETIKCRHYLRYMDDLIVFDSDKARLNDIKRAIDECLKGLKLELHPRKSQIYLTAGGVSFLGYKIYPTHRLTVSSNVKRERKRLKKYLVMVKAGLIDWPKLLRSLRSWLGYARRADSFNLRRRLLGELNLLYEG
jgi:RNA-directed DNA polymerase